MFFFTGKSSGKRKSTLEVGQNKYPRPAKMSNISSMWKEK